MNQNAEQLEMLGRHGVTLSAEFQDEVTRGCRDRHHALVKCYEVSNLQPKQVYLPLGIEQGTFSRILGGTAYLPHTLKFQFMDICGNDIPLRYDALGRGYELKPVQSTLEQENEKLRAELEDERRVNRRLAEMLRGR